MSLSNTAAAVTEGMAWRANFIPRRRRQRWPRCYRWVSNLGNRYSDVGRREEALPPRGASPVAAVTQAPAMLELMLCARASPSSGTRLDRSQRLSSGSLNCGSSGVATAPMPQNIRPEPSGRPNVAHRTRTVHVRRKQRRRQRHERSGTAQRRAEPADDHTGAERSARARRAGRQLQRGGFGREHHLPGCLAPQLCSVRQHSVAQTEVQAAT